MKKIMKKWQEMHVKLASIMTPDSLRMHLQLSGFAQKNVVRAISSFFSKSHFYP